MNIIPEVDDRLLQNYMDKKYECEFCGKRFAARKELTNHQELNHKHIL